MAAGTNVMPIAPKVAQPGKGRQISGDSGGSSGRNAVRGRAVSQKNGKFGDVLEQTQDISDFPKGSIGAVDEAADLPKDPIAAAIAATSQPKQQETKAASGENDAAEQPSQVKASTVTEDTVSGAKTQVRMGMAGVVLDSPAKNEVPSANLQTLLPQSDEVVQKGKSMLDILSGRGWKQYSGQRNDQAVGVVEVNETASQTTDLPNSQMANGTRFMGMFQNRVVEVSQVQAGDTVKTQDVDIPQAKTMNMSQAQVVWTAQDARGVSNQQMQQLIQNEEPKQMQYGMQQNRPQAQPGMQGMPVMQDAQASLTRPMQNVSVSQNLQSVQNQTGKDDIVLLEDTVPLADTVPLKDTVPSEDAVRPAVQRNPEAVSNALKEAAEMTSPLQPEQEKVSGTQGFAIPQDRIQQIDRRQDAFSFKPTDKDPVSTDRIPVSEDTAETGSVIPQETLKQVPTAPSTVAEPIKSRQELNREPTDLPEVVDSNEVETEQPVEPVRQMMHGEEQRGNSRQQSEERRPMQQTTVLPEDMLEGRESHRANVQQQVQEPVLQPNPQHQQPIGFQQTLNTAQVQASETAQPQMAPGQDFDIPGQIVEQARLIRNSGNTEMVMHLKPEHLGDLTLRVSVSEHGAVTASFHSDNAQVRAIIEHSLVQLKQELSNQGIKVDNVEVYAGLSDDGLLNGQSQQAWQQNQQDGSRRNRSFDMEAFEEESGELSAIPDYEGSEEGVDYRV